MTFNDIKKKDFLTLSFILFPFFLIFSRFLADFYTSVLSIIFISLIIIKKYKIKNNIFTYCLYFFYIYLLFNSAFSFEPVISYYKSFFYFRFIFFSFLISYLINKDKTLITIIVYSFLITHSLLLISVFYQIFIFSDNLFHIGRASGFFGDELVLGGYVSKTLPIILSLIYLDKKNHSKRMEYYLLFISFIMVILSAERTALASIVIVLFLYGLLTFSKMKNLIIILVILVSGFIYNGHYPQTFKRLFLHTIVQIKSSTNYIAPSFRHQLHWETAINLFLDRKYLGQGLYSFRNLCDDKRFNPIKTIIKNNQVLAITDGFFDYGDIVKDEKNITTLKYILKKFNIHSNNNFEYYLNKNQKIIPVNIGKGGYILNLQKLGVPVKKDQYLFSQYEFSNGCNTHPHNIHLQFLSELGIFGYVFLLFFFLYLFSLIAKNLFKNFYLKKDINLSLFYSSLGLLIFLFPLLPSGSFFNNWISIIFYFNLSTFLYNKIYLK